MPKLLITGGSGFIGSHFHRALPESTITNIDLVEPELPYTSNFIKGDVRLQKDVEKAIEKSQCDTILHLAAVHDDFGRSRADYFDTNEGGAQQLCEAATKFSVQRIIFFSTVAVYGNKPTPTHEKMLPRPGNPYGASKLAAEKVLEQWAAADKNRKVLIIRPALIYGERNTANMYRLIEQIQKGRYFHIGAGNNIKSIGYVKNLVDATKYLTRNLQTGVQVYNFADVPQMTSREIASTILKALYKKEAPTIPYWLAYTLGLPFDLLIKLTGRNLPISTNRIHKFCMPTYHRADKLAQAGFLPKWSNKIGLERMVHWYVTINQKITSEDLAKSLSTVHK